MEKRVESMTKVNEDEASSVDLRKDMGVFKVHLEESVRGFG